MVVDVFVKHHVKEAGYTVRHPVMMVCEIVRHPVVEVEDTADINYAVSQIVVF